MALLKRLTKQQIRDKYTHYGLFWGCVPVYVNMLNDECPDVATRNWIPEWTLDFVDWLSWLPIQLMTLANPEYKPMFAIALTALIEEPE